MYRAGDIIIITGGFKKRTFLQWLLRKERQLEKYVVR